MPTPLGHAVAGAAIAWTLEAVRRTPMRVTGRVTLAAACAFLAVSPDLDLVYPPLHRTLTHSVLAPVAAAIAAAALARRARREAVGLTALVCGAAYGSHMLLDFLGGDTKMPAGIQFLWPFDDRWFMSSLGLFRATDIGRFFEPRIMLSNLLAVLIEICWLAPLAAGAWILRARRIGGVRRESVSASLRWRVTDDLES